VVEGGGGGRVSFWKALIFKKQVKLKVRLNDKVVDRTEFGKTQNKICLLCVVPNVMS
jgi:hypothetical protein